ncbi:MAG: hypothetical protein J2P37_17625 [Ktedonobacteraceae bacterium]|nr:hypothetical protein [Ktedonobacteraceae bacterium]
MARSLYRFFLYAIYIALLNFIAFTTGQLLYNLLTQTPLRGSYGHVPSPQEITQSLVFAAVSWVIAGALAGLFYWLIRRDMSSDPAASNSAVRSFFLNVTEGLTILSVVPAIGFSLSELASSPDFGVAGLLSYALPFLAVVILLELERRRGKVTTGGALFWQRFHFFGAQWALLFMLSWSWYSLRPLVAEVLGLRLASCSGDPAYCPASNPIWLLLSMLWFAASWLLYCLATSKDTSRLVRLIMHGAGLAYGAGFALVGISTVIKLALAPLFHYSLTARDLFGSGAQFDFFSSLTLGLLCAGGYHWLYSNAARRGLLEKAVARLIEVAIVAITLAVTFWWGLGYMLYNMLQQVTHMPAGPDNVAWISALALLITGLAYVPLDFYLQRRHATVPQVATGPRRGFVLFVLGGGILAFAIGGATALYAWGTALLGSPIDHWQQVSHSGLAAFLVGATLLGIYLVVAIREHLITRTQKQPQPAQPARPEPQDPATQYMTLETILDELLAGHITRDQAATLIRSLTQTPVA